MDGFRGRKRERSTPKETLTNGWRKTNSLPPAGSERLNMPPPVQLRPRGVRVGWNRCWLNRSSRCDPSVMDHMDSSSGNRSWPNKEGITQNRVVRSL